ncbi:TroA family protein [Loktanella agnita]|uniref:hypothetical protein n=1 Tax=Loktanella agnita TaxID=287097 RepID=UPI0039863CAC
MSLCGLGGTFGEAQVVVNDAFEDPSAISIGVIEPRKNGTIRGFRNYDALTQIIRDLGFSMPETITGQDAARIDISAELSDQFEADFMISTYWPANGTTVAAIYELWDSTLPIWRETLHAVRNNQYFMIEREKQRPVTFESLDYVLGVLVSQIATRDFVPLGPDTSH